MLPPELKAGFQGVFSFEDILSYSFKDIGELQTLFACFFGE
jgi:hypothetical protein